MEDYHWTHGFNILALKEDGISLCAAIFFKGFFNFFNKTIIYWSLDQTSSKHLAIVRIQECTLSIEQWPSPGSIELSK
ncbi:hypothetical protein VULLAG_LOCUS16776 [Vulpes lagopus]